MEFKYNIMQYNILYYIWTLSPPAQSLALGVIQQKMFYYNYLHFVDIACWGINKLLLLLYEQYENMIILLYGKYLHDHRINEEGSCSVTKPFSIYI